MQQFLIIAAAHFLALLSPGPDFFLVARLSLSAGWRVASGACVGIALANGVFIVLALGGVTILVPGSPLFVALQAAGGAYLLYLGVLFLRHAGGSALVVTPAGASNAPNASSSSSGASASGAAARVRGIAWHRAAGMGFLSGILNPKNALFYASLAAMLTGPAASPGWKVIYGAWMFSAVLLWDGLVAGLIGHPVVLRRFARALPWLERLSGAMLILLALGVGVMLWR